MDWNERARKLNTAIRPRIEGLDLVDDTAATEWYGRALTALMLVLDADEEIAFVDGVVLTEEEEEGHYADFYVFTPALVAHVSGRTNADEQPNDPLVEFWPRADLKSLTLGARASAFDSSFPHTDWPGSLAVNVRYAGRAEITFPVGVRNSRWRTREYQQLVAELSSDLCRGGSRK